MMNEKVWLVFEASFDNDGGKLIFRDYYDCKINAYNEVKSWPDWKRGVVVKAKIPMKDID